MTLLATVNDNSTKPNSPACARPRANNHRSLPLILKITARIRRTAILSAMRPRVRPMMSIRFAPSRPKLIPAPTVIKNRPSSRPLNGSMSDSSSWRYSEFARTTPAMNVPRAGDNPTSDINSAMPITIISAVAVNNSRRFAPATNRKIGEVRKLPQNTTAATAPMVTSAVCHGLRPSTRLMLSL